MTDFTTWVLRRQRVLPQADRLILLIRAAGASGIPEGEVRSSIELPRKTVDGLLAALVQARQIVMVQRQGRRFCVGR